MLIFIVPFPFSLIVRVVRRSEGWLVLTAASSMVDNSLLDKVVFVNSTIYELKVCIVTFFKACTFLNHMILTFDIIIMKATTKVRKPSKVSPTISGLQNALCSQS